MDPRMYETMTGQEAEPSLATESPIMRDYTEIRQADGKTVHSRVLGLSLLKRFE